MSASSRSSSTRPAPSPWEPPPRSREAHGASVDGSPQRTDQRPPRLPGVWRGSRRAVCPRRSDAGDGWSPRRRERDGVSRGVQHALPGVRVAGGVAALAVRQRRRRGSGVAAALRVKGSDVRVLAQGGDGGTMDIGFGCLSGMFERNDDVLYVCYDNEAYMNTGSSARAPPPRPPVRAPPPGRGSPRQPVRHRQEPSPPRHGARHSVRRDRIGRGPARSGGQGRTCDGVARRPLPSRSRAVSAGWAATRRRPSRLHDSRSNRVSSRCSRRSMARSPARLPSAGASTSTNTCVCRPASPTCSTGALVLRRTSRASRPSRTATWCGSARACRKGEPVNKPFAITLDSASSRANHTGAWRVRRPVYVERLSPWRPRVPRRRAAAGLARARRKRDYRAAWDALVQHNPIPAVMGAPATTRARRPAIAPSSTRRSPSTPSNGSSAISPSASAGRCPPQGDPRANACSSSRRAERTRRRVPPDHRRALGHAPRGGPRRSEA